MKPSKSQAKARIQRALGEIPGLRQVDADSQVFKRWRRNAELAISNTFADGTRHSNEFNGIGYTGVYIVGATGGYVANAKESYLEGLDTAEAILSSMADEIEEYWEDDLPTPSEPYSPNPMQQPGTKKVFVVHGRDQGTLSMVARFLENQDLEPVILQERPNEGNTIIEKFEENAPVGFAVVLCTPDDVGALASDQDNLKPRPRQNVVLEWGFFLGRIGRGRVCALIKGDVEIPSDYSGVVYVKMDDGPGWQVELARELREAGFPVDANKIL